MGRPTTPSDKALPSRRLMFLSYIHEQGAKDVSRRNDDRIELASILHRELPVVDEKELVPKIMRNVSKCAPNLPRSP